jgi:hypothetical protein
MPSSPPLLPLHEDIVVAVACMFTWYWVADICLKEGIPFVLGHVLYRKAIHGGKAKNDKIDSKKITVLPRAGMIPSRVRIQRRCGQHGISSKEEHTIRRRLPLQRGAEYDWKVHKHIHI